MAYPTAHTVISFTDCSAANGVELSIELDEDKHLELYEDATKSTFYAGERSYYKIYFSRMVDLLLASTSGTVRQEIGIGVETKTEYITFQNTNTGNLSKTPYGVVSYSWVGTTQHVASPVFDGKTITLNTQVVGVLKCVYSVQYKKMSAIVQDEDLVSTEVVNNANAELDEATVVVYVVSNTSGVAGSAFYSITYLRSLAEIEITITIEDYVTGEAISEATVYINNVEVGVTDSYGKINVMVTPGVAYSYRAVKGGYYVNSADIFHNESFTIPIESARRIQ